MRKFFYGGFSRKMIFILLIPAGAVEKNCKNLPPRLLFNFRKILLFLINNFPPKQTV